MRRERGLTQGQLAIKLGVSRQAIGKWESGLSYPGVDKLALLGDLLDCSIDSLLREGGAAYQGDPVAKTGAVFDVDSFTGSWCNIELKGWDSGYFDVVIVAQDESYIEFCQAGRAQSLKRGLVAKRYVDTVSSAFSRKRGNAPSSETLQRNAEEHDPFHAFLGRKCDIQAHSSGFAEFVLSSDGFQGAKVLSVDGDCVVVDDGGTSVAFQKEAIAGIVES